MDYKNLIFIITGALCLLVSLFCLKFPNSKKLPFFVKCFLYNPRFLFLPDAYPDKDKKKEVNSFVGWVYLLIGIVLILLGAGLFVI